MQLTRRDTMRTRVFKRTKLAVSITSWLAIVMVIGVAGCQEDKRDDLSHRLTYDPEFRRKYETQRLLEEIEKASIIAHSTYEVSEINEEFCGQRIVEIWRGKDLEEKLSRFKEDGSLCLVPINKDGTCSPDSIALFTASEESADKSVRPFAEHHIHDGKIQGGMTVEEVHTAALRQR